MNAEQRKSVLEVIQEFDNSNLESFLRIRFNRRPSMGSVFVGDYGYTLFTLSTLVKKYSANSKIDWMQIIGNFYLYLLIIQIMD